MNKLKVGIVGQRGLSVVQGIKLDGRAEVAAFCEINEDLLHKAAAEHGIPRTFRVYEDMLECDLDIIVVATPMQLHAQHVIGALLSGRHVLCEVTAGIMLDELWWLVEAVQKSGKTYMMAENYLYIPEVQIITNMVAQGLFGDTYFAEGEYIHNMESYLGSDKNFWRRYWQAGKRGNFYPTHSLGPAMKWLGGRIKSVASFGTGSHTSKVHRQDDTSITMCSVEGDKLVKLRLDSISRRPHNLSYYALQGTRGCYEAPRGEGENHKIWVGDFDGEAHFQNLHDYSDYLPERYKNATEEQKSAGHWGGDFFIVQDFLDAVVNGTKPYVDIFDACEWTAVALLSELSVTNNGKAFDMPDFRKYEDRSQQRLELR